MSIDDKLKIEIVDIEIQLKAADLKQEEVDERTRELASQLRLLPHKTVGIASSQTPGSGTTSLSGRTEGRIAMSLPAAGLPKVVELLLADGGGLLRGPNEVTLDLSGPVSREQINVWLSAAAKQPIVQDEPGNHTKEMDRFELPSVQELRSHARHHIESGAVTEEYLADRQQVLNVLNQVLATELVCILRYKSHYYNASGIDAPSVKAEFAEHALEAEQHANQVAARITQLNGAPDFNPDGLLSRSLSEFTTATTLTEMIKEDLIAERIAVEFYSAIIRWLGDSDLTTRRVMQEILAVEAQHAEDMKALLGRLRLSDRDRGAQRA